MDFRLLHLRDELGGLALMLTLDSISGFHNLASVDKEYLNED